MNNILTLLLFGMLILGCTSNQENHKKKEILETPLEFNEGELQALIDRKEDLNLFLSYWYGMTKQEFDGVSLMLLRNKKIFKENSVLYFDFKILLNESKLYNIPCKLVPNFGKNNKLNSLGLFLKRDSRFLTISNRHFYCINKINARRLLNLYEKKYRTPLETPNPKNMNDSEKFSIYSDFINDNKMVRIKEKRIKPLSQSDADKLSRKQQKTIKDFDLITTGGSYVKSSKDPKYVVTSFGIHYSLSDYFRKVDTFKKVRNDSIKKQRDNILNEQFESL